MRVSASGSKTVRSIVKVYTPLVEIWLGALLGGSRKYYLYQENEASYALAGIKIASKYLPGT